MNINNNTPNSPNVNFEFFAAKVKGNTVVFQRLNNKEKAAAFDALSKNQPLKNFAYRRSNGEMVVSKDAFSEERTYVLKENGKTTPLSGRVRVMNEADVAEIKQFAANYFARMKEGEEKVIVKAGIHAKISQPAKESDKKISNAAKKGIETANERAEEERGKENRTLEIKGNLETGKKIRRFYEEMKSKSAQIAEFQKETRENKIN